MGNTLKANHMANFIKNTSSERSITLNNQLFNSPSSVSASVISFGQKKKTVNLESRKYSYVCEFPSYKKVPDGFKHCSGNSSKYIPLITKKGILIPSAAKYMGQITVFDRHKDLKYQEIQAKYDQNVKIWKDEWKAEGGKLNSEWKQVLINKTAEYIRNINTEPLNVRVRHLESDYDINHKESYLGDVYAKRENVCRHDAFLFKMLLEDYGINAGINSGFVLGSNGINNHTWNELTDENGRKIPYDVNFDNLNTYYFTDIHGDYLYKDTFSPVQKTQFDILSLQFGEKIKLGFDDKNNLVSSKMNDNADFFVTAELTPEPEIKFELIKDTKYEHNQSAKDYLNMLKDTFPIDAVMMFLQFRYKMDCRKLIALSAKADDNLDAKIAQADPELNETTREFFSYLYNTQYNK